MNNIQNNRRYRKGFSLVELVIVILVIAVLALAVFAGGSVVVKKSQVSRTVSDLHNFSIAVESTMNENPSIANITDSTGHSAIVDALNRNLPEDYRVHSSLDAKTGNITMAAITVGADNHFTVYESDKTDSWGNPYYVLLDDRDLTLTPAASEFYITVVSAGPNAKTALNGTINNDDIFLLGHYRNGDVVATTYNVAERTNGTVYQADARVGTPSNF